MLTVFNDKHFPAKIWILQKLLCGPRSRARAPAIGVRIQSARGHRALSVRENGRWLKKGKDRLVFDINYCSDAAPNKGFTTQNSVTKAADIL